MVRQNSEMPRQHAPESARCVPDPWWGLGTRLGLVHIERFWGTQDAACHVIVMTMHRFGMATHQWLSCAAIVGYCTVSHDNHMQATWHESDWCNRIQKCHVSNPRKRSIYWGWGLGMRLTVTERGHCRGGPSHCGPPKSCRSAAAGSAVPCQNF